MAAPWGCSLFPLGAGPTMDPLALTHTDSDGQSKLQAWGSCLEKAASYFYELSRARRIKQLAGRLARGGCSIYSSGTAVMILSVMRAACGSRFPWLSQETAKPHTMPGSW